MKNSALLVTDGFLADESGKTAHGLITGLSRFPIVGVIDHKHAGLDAGVVVDRIARGIPVFASIHDAIESLGYTPEFCIVGIAVHGGRITPSLEKTLASAIEAKISIINGLHEQISEHPVLQPLLSKHGVTAKDIRKPKPVRDLKSWSGEIRHVNTPRIAVLGMDCAIGKRTTCQMLFSRCNDSGLKAEMIYTGQTGWLQGFRYGFILDSTLNDFVSGELEHAVVTCAREAKPDVILLEGQSSLRNPSGPCGAEYICSAGAKGIILQYPAGREFFSNQETVGSKLPSLDSEIDLFKLYGAEVLAIAVNTKDLKSETWQQAKQRIARETGLVTVCPREEGVDEIIPLIRSYIEQQSLGTRS